MPKTGYFENDCWAYAIANMVSMLHGIYHRSVIYNVSAMRRHLQQGLENEKITVFPIENSFVKINLC